MPSMPMFTMPARSAHRPARPASRMGVATRMVDEMVPELVRSSAPVMMRAIDSTSMRPRPAMSRRVAGDAAR